VRNSVKKWYGFGVVLMRSGEKKWESEKKLQILTDFEKLAQRCNGAKWRKV